MAETEKEKIIEVKGLTAGYGGEPVLDNISFDVKKGEVFRGSRGIRVRKKHIV